VESPDRVILEMLLEHPDIAKAHGEAGGGGIRAGAGRKDLAASTMAQDLVSLDLTKAAKNAQEAELAAAEAQDASPKGSKRRWLAGQDLTDGCSKRQRMSPAHDDYDRELASAEAAAAQAEIEMEAAAQSFKRALRTGGHGDGEQSVVKQAADACQADRGTSLVEASASRQVSTDVEIYSFEIAASHVRASCAIASWPLKRFRTFLFLYPWRLRATTNKVTAM
jgi:hypothetical protein